MQSPDLFGFIPVSLQEVELWLYLVPRMAHYQRGRAAYVNGWNVVDKIQRAKLDGRLDSIFGDRSCEFCGQPLCQDQADNSPPVSPDLEVKKLQRRIAVLELVMQCQAARAELEARPLAVTSAS